MSAEKFFEALSKIGELLPSDLVLQEMIRNGIDSISLKEWILFPYWGTCDVDVGEITLNPSLDRSKVAEALSMKFGIPVQPEEIYIPIFFHELHHHRNRGKLREGRNSESIRQQAEAEACGYAKHKFQEWKKAKDEQKQKTIEAVREAFKEAFAGL